jgi:choline kinase
VSGIRKAVILAAGRGNRIAAVGNIPKPLLSLSGRPGDDTFLDWHLRALQRAGVQEIYLVGNRITHGTRLRAMADVEATWLLNDADDADRSGSALSAHVAWSSPHGILDGESAVLLMDADLLYHPEILVQAAALPASRTLTLVAGEFEETAEEVMVFARPDAPQTAVRHGKGLLGTPIVDGLLPVGEAMGMALFHPDDHGRLLGTSKWALSYSSAKQRCEHEDVTQLLMDQGRVEVAAFGSEWPFMEVDTPAEYAVATQTLYPRLQGLLG